MVAATGRNEQCDARCVDGWETFGVALRPPSYGHLSVLAHASAVSAVRWAKLVAFAISHTIYVMTDILRRPT